MNLGIPLRLRLTLLSAALVGFTLLIFSLIVYFTLGRALTAEVDRALADRAHVVRSSIGLNVTPAGIEVELPDVDAIAAGGAVVQVVDLADGRIKARSQALGRLQLPVSREALEAARNRQPLFELVQVGGVDLRLYNEPLVLGNSARAILQVARPVAPTEEALGRLRLVLLGGAIASVLVCTLISWLIARAALRPIDALTREAERIGTSLDFGTRVSVQRTRTRDEVGRLATTFNAMLDRLQAAYADLQQANQKLAAALESQRRFVADASHELRTPLTTVRGNASLLRRFEALTPEDRQAVVEQIGAESERMSRLVNDLLTLARADAGQLLESKPVPLWPLIESVMLQGRVLAQGKLAVSVLRLGSAPPEEAVVRGDADALRQLLLILVDNAIKYTPAGGSVTLSLRVDRDHGEQRVARVTVVDTGMGIAPEDQRHIFDRFYRADPARRAGGTGLGLAIGKWIAEAHGGSITVESSPGAGSIFTVTLPVCLPEWSAAPQSAGATPSPGDSAPSPPASPPAPVPVS